jgi:hypothetical protein
LHVKTRFSCDRQSDSTVHVTKLTPGSASRYRWESLDEKLERVARTTGRKIRALDDKLGVSDGVTAAAAVWAGEVTQVVT